MLKDLNYIIFDFETTGLDIKKDEPIQIGLIQFDKDFNIKNTFSSYIKPKKNINELKDIVSFITGLSLKDLEKAPFMEDVLTEIKKFFDENTVIVGHNIEFDYKMLKKYYKDLNVLQMVDTFVVAKNIIHNFPSYSLEVLFEYIKDKENIDIPNLGKAHDALVDSFMTFYFFKYSINYLEKLLSDYPVIATFIQKSDSFWKNILDLANFKTRNIDYFLPSFKKEIVNRKRILLDNKNIFSSVEYFNELSLSKYSLLEIVKEAISSNDKFIISVSNKGKLKFLESIFKQYGFEDIGYLTGDRVFNVNKIKKFLTKYKFDDFEINFIIKYFSLIKQGYSYFEINDLSEVKILNYLSEKRENNSSKIIITTHGGLLNALLSGKEYKNYKLLFLDTEWWYVSLSKVLNRTYDFYNFLNKLESILYYLKFEADSEVVLDFEKFVNTFIIFMGIFYSELTNKFRGKQVDKLEIGPVLSDIDFWKTKKIYESLRLYLTNILPKIQKYSDIVDELNDLFLIIDKILTQIIVVYKKMLGDKFNFIFGLGNEPINWRKFKEILNGKFDSVYFGKLEKVKINNFFRKLDIDYIKTKKSIFVLSTKRSSSKQVFEKLIKDEYILKNYIVLVENLTGSRGKSLFLAKKYDKKIVVGGNEFYFMLLGSGVSFDDVIVYDIDGPMKDIILKEVSWWKVDNG